MKPEKLSAFGERLLEAFGDVSENMIADVMQIDVSELSKYLETKMPDTEALKRFPISQVFQFIG